MTQIDPIDPSKYRLDGPGYNPIKQNRALQDLISKCNEIVETLNTWAATKTTTAEKKKAN